MKKFIENIVEKIVKNPKDISVKEKKEGDYLNYTLRVNPEDIKIIIGKKGRTIQALSKLARIKAFKIGKKVYIRIET